MSRPVFCPDHVKYQGTITYEMLPFSFAASDECDCGRESLRPASQPRKRARSEGRTALSAITFHSIPPRIAASLLAVIYYQFISTPSQAERNGETVAVAGSSPVTRLNFMISAGHGCLQTLRSILRKTDIVERACLRLHRHFCCREDSQRALDPRSTYTSGLQTRPK
jgi:hypothetical protein